MNTYTVTSETHAESAFDTGSSVELHGVTKKFGRTVAVDSVDLRIEAGEFVTLLGPSGSGKTTILRIIAGFVSPTSGSLTMGGRQVTRLSPAERNIGMVFQHYALFPHLTVQQNVAYGLRVRHWPKVERHHRVEQMLDLVGLSEFADRRPHELSGGQQQRVALARALAIRPQLLLMDEPLGALDRALRVDMSEELKRLHRETGTTFLYVTHDQEEALLLSDRVAIMRDGKVRAIGTPEELFNAPPTRFVAEFFSNCNVLKGASVSQLSDGQVTVRYGGRELSLATTSKVEAVAFQPHKAVVLKEGQTPTNSIIITGRVTDVLFMGMLHQIALVDSFGQRIIVRVPASAARSVSPGDPIRLAVAEADVVPLRPEA